MARSGAIRLLFLLSLLASPDFPNASQVRSVNLEEMTQRATLIFSGTCTDLGTERNAALGVDVLVVTFKVDRRIKGHLGRTLTIRTLATGTSAADRSDRLPDSPGFQVATSAGVNVSRAGRGVSFWANSASRVGALQNARPMLSSASITPTA
jgi:hypothetical protein